jgi:hypothetical protein
VTIKIAPSTTLLPTATASCEAIGLTNINANGAFLIPAGDTGIVIKLPEADVPSQN